LVKWKIANAADEVGLVGYHHCLLDTVNAEAILEILILDALVLHIFHADLQNLLYSAMLEAVNQVSCYIGQ